MTQLQPTHAETTGRFHLLEVVGQGAFATVYRAIDRRNRSVVALKSLDEDGSDDLLDLQVEFQLLAALDHPGLVQVDELVQWQGRATLVMEWVDGRRLDEVFDDRPALFRAIPSLVEALAHLHGQGLVHGDLKPANVLVRDGRCVLVDLGFAAEAGTDGTGGTPFYLAPERFLGGAAQPSSDLYALGVTLSEALTDAPDALEAALLARHQGQEPPLPIEDSVLRELLAPLVRVDPEGRPDIHTVHRQIVQWFGQASLPEEVVLPSTIAEWLAGGDSCAEVSVERTRNASLVSGLLRWCRAEGTPLFQSHCVPGRRFNALEGLLLRTRSAARLAEDPALQPLLQAMPGSPHASAARHTSALAAALMELLQVAETPALWVVDGFEDVDEDSIVVLGELLARSRIRLLLLTGGGLPSGSPAAAFLREWGGPNLGDLGSPSPPVLPAPLLEIWGVLGAIQTPLPLEQVLSMFPELDGWRSLRQLERQGCLVRVPTRDGVRVSVRGRTPPTDQAVVRSRLEQIRSDEPLVVAALARIRGEGASEARALVTAVEQALSRLAFRHAKALLTRLEALEVDPAVLLPLEARALVGIGHWEPAGRAWLAAADHTGDMDHRLRAAEVLIGAGLIEEGEQALRTVLAHHGLPSAREGLRALVRTLWDRLAMKLGLAAHPADARALEAAFVGTGVLSYFDSVAGFGLQTRYLRLARDSESPLHRARALHQELVWQASQNDPEELARVGEAYALAAATPEAQADAYHDTLAAFALFLGGRFTEALDAFRGAGLRSELEGRMTWERDFCTVHGAICLMFLGRREELSRLVRRGEQGDPGSRTPVRQAWQDLGAAYVLDLAADRPEAAQERIDRAASSFGNRARMISYLAMVARARVALYRGDPAAVFAELERERWSLRLLGGSNQSVRVMAAWLEGLACTLTSGLASTRRLAGCVGRLEADQACFAPGLAPALRAALLVRKGHHEEAAGLRAEAIRLHRERGLAPYADALDPSAPQPGDVVDGSAWARMCAPSLCPEAL